MSAGDDEGDVGGHFGGVDEGGEQVALHVVYADEGFAGDAGHCFCGCAADEEGGGEAGAHGGGEDVDIADAQGGCLESFEDKAFQAEGV